MRLGMMKLFGVSCPYCDAAAVMVLGQVIYPHRKDLASLNFWHCAPCGAYVGCHKPNAQHGFDGTQPLGRLANAELRAAKQRAHAAFDPIWTDGYMSRKKAYAWLSSALRIKRNDCHIGEFDVITCNRVVEVVTVFWRDDS